MFESSNYDVVKVSDLMVLPPEQIVYGNSMEEVFSKFEGSGAWNLPVVDELGVYVGFVSRSRILSIYREKLVDLSNE